MGVNVAATFQERYFRTEWIAQQRRKHLHSINACQPLPNSRHRFHYMGRELFSKAPARRSKFPFLEFVLPNQPLVGPIELVQLHALYADLKNLVDELRKLIQEPALQASVVVSLLHRCASSVEFFADCLEPELECSPVRH